MIPASIFPKYPGVWGSAPVLSYQTTQELDQ